MALKKWILQRLMKKSNRERNKVRQLQLQKAELERKISIAKSNHSH